MTANTDLFRKAWGKFPTGVSIITTFDDKNEVHAMTANGILSVSLEPLLSLVSIGLQANSLRYVRQSRRYGISLLRDDQHDMAFYYAKKPEDREKLPAPTSSRLVQAGGNFKVENALAYFDCRVVSSHAEGDHILFVGAVDSVEVGQGNPLVFYEGKWPKLVGG